MSQKLVSQSQPRRRIIILGGGFAGVKCAKTLRKLLSKEDVEIVLFNKENHMVFHPLLAEVASAAIKTKDVAAPLRLLLSKVKCRTEEVLNIDLDGSFVEYEAYDGTRRKMSYDQIVISCGTSANLAMIQGMDEHAFALKTVGDALLIQSHVIDQLEKAEVCDDPEKKSWFLSFIVIGGGFSGVEVAGEINELVRKSCRYYESVCNADVRVVLVHSQSQILPEVNPSLREFARAKMEKVGVEFILNAAASHANNRGVFLKDETFVPGATIVCTVGTRPHFLVERLTIEKDRGRLKTCADMSLPGYNNAWSIGDCAAIPNEVTGEMSPPVAQFAERQGVQVAHNIKARLDDKPTSPFSYHMKGVMCSIGGHNAVAQIGNFRVSGFPAWFLWRSIYLMKLPSFMQKCKVGIEWACDLIFPRDITYVKTDRSRSVSRAFYAPGNYIFRQNDPANDFFVIEQGEVDILIMNEKNGHEDLVAILGAGDFFGEAALVTNRPRNASVRARTNVLVVTMGRGLFSEMSALTPLRDAIAKAVRRRRNVWKELPEVQNILENMPLEKIVEELPCDTLKPTDYLDKALTKFTCNELDFFFVVDAQNRVVGLVTRSDLLRTIEVAVSLQGQKDDIIRVHHIMSHSPIVISKDETST
ncbi:MAG: FAD-dependent oxidoreductase, partial [Candidatus Obscuribacterales bacterium]|nr:FAD-dependent oxidoreductase [Candidatus Obscuribacterales bacterium]